MNRNDFLKTSVLAPILGLLGCKPERWQLEAGPPPVLVENEIRYTPEETFGSHRVDAIRYFDGSLEGTTIANGQTVTFTSFTITEPAD